MDCGLPIPCCSTINNGEISTRKTKSTRLGVVLIFPVRSILVKIVGNPQSVLLCMRAPAWFYLLLRMYSIRLHVDPARARPFSLGLCWVFSGSFLGLSVDVLRLFSSFIFVSFDVDAHVRDSSHSPQLPPQENNASTVGPRRETRNAMEAQRAGEYRIDG